MNQYEIERIMHQIDGYMIPSPSKPLETFNASFERAKAELVKNLKHHLSQVEAFTIEDWRKHHKAKRKAAS